MSTKRPQYSLIKVSGQNPTPEQARDYVYIDKYPEEQMEIGFFELRPQLLSSVARQEILSGSIQGQPDNHHLFEQQIAHSEFGIRRREPVAIPLHPGTQPCCIA